MPPFDVLGFGEHSIDEIYRLPTLPRDGASTKIPIITHARRPGGQVATTLSACAALGLRAAYAGAFGDDENSRVIRDALAGAGVDVASCIVRRGKGRYAVILVEERTGERVVLWHKDPAVALRPEDITPAMVSAARLVHVDAVDIDASLHAARLAREAGVPVTSDIDAVADGTWDLLDAVSVPILAERAAQQLTGEADLERALRRIRQRQAGLLCATCGERGSVLLAGDRFHQQPAFSVPAVDTTGAGDVFRAGFIYALLRGDPPDAMLRFANAAAALSCTREGALGSVPTLEEVERLIGAG
jgi:sugar/nucleoside kinase (ribokinase family)